MNAKGFVVPPGGGSRLNMAPSCSAARPVDGRSRGQRSPRAPWWEIVGPPPF
jgi:hypothetical protein